MAETAFQRQYRQEMIAGFEVNQSLLRDTVTTEAVIKGNEAEFLVAASGDKELCLIALDDGFGGDGITQERLVYFETSNHFLPILTLKSCFSHWIASLLKCETQPTQVVLSGARVAFRAA